MNSEIAQALERWVMQDGKPVTARLLSVQHKINVGQARAYMQQLIEQSEKKGDAKPYALWLLRGPMTKPGAKDSQDSEHAMDVDEEATSKEIMREAMLLADDEQLDDTKASFDTSPSVTLYSLSPPLTGESTSAHRVSAVSQLTTIQHDLKNTPQLIKAWDDSERGVGLGAIRPADDIIFTGKPGSTSAGVVEQMDTKTNAPTVRAEPAQSKAKVEQAPAAAATNRKINQATSKAKARAVKSEESKEKAEKRAAMHVEEAEDSEQDDGPIGYAIEKSASDVPADEGGATHKRADAGDKKSTLEERRRQQRKELMDMMDEDRDGDADPEVPVAASTSTSMMGGEGAHASTEKGPEEKGPKKSGGKRRVRKQRKVIRKETGKNEKGYRVTRDVEGYESYSSFESSEDEQAKPAKGARSKAAKKTANKGDENASSPQKKDADQEENDAEPVNEIGKAKPTVEASAPPPVATKKAANPSGAGTSGQRKLSSFFAKKS